MKNWTILGLALLVGGTMGGCRIDADDDVPDTTVIHTQPPVVVEDKTTDVTIEHKTPPIIIDKGADVEIKKAETTRSTTGF